MIADFENAIRQKNNIHFRDIIRFAGQFLPNEFAERPDLYFKQDKGRTDRGTKPIRDDDGIMCYLCAWGEMHVSKLRMALDDCLSPREGYPKISIPRRINVVDWGCGQGLGTFALLDHLEGKGYDVAVDNVILIEPSPLALEYAQLYLSLRLKGQDTRISTVCKFFSSLDREDLQMRGDAPVFHLYSNILDVPDINMKDLACWLREFRQRDNYIISTSPCYWSGNARIEQFYSYFNRAEVLSSMIESNRENNEHGPFTYNIRVSKLLAEAAQRIRDLKFYSPRQFFGIYRIDTFQDEEASLFRPFAAFDVYAPYEIGTSYSDDIDPVYAVLSNMISRGLPTKASPYVEEILSSVYGNSEKTIKYGGISYLPAIPEADRIKISEDVRAGKYTGEKVPLLLTPVAVARIQKTIVEALITERLDINSKKWKVVIEEADVPCGALAIEDLRQMFSALVPLTRDYDGRRLPEIELTIVNSHFKNSPLHLGVPVYGSSEDVPKDEYDLVIDYTTSVKPEGEYLFSKYNVRGDDCYYAVFSATESTAQRYIYTTDLINYKPLIRVDDAGHCYEDQTNVDHLEYFLRLLFRKERFRTGQIPILNRVLQNKSVIGLLPTGGGKSLTYQLAALMQPGVTVVIDPLRSLMEDQYDGLLSAGIDCCTLINADIDIEERKRREYRIECSQCLFAFMSPERLCIYSFRKRLKNMYDSNVYFSYGVIDEVHCVSEWGQDFRFTYLHLGRNLYNYVRSKNGVVTLFGLTATASFDVLADVERELSGNGAYDLDSDVLVRCEDTNRLELQYRVIPVPIEFEKDKNFTPPEGYPGYLPTPYVITRINRNENKSNALPGIIDSIPGMLRELMEENSVNKIVECFYGRESRPAEPEAGAVLATEMPDDFASKKEHYDQSGIVFCPHKGSTDVSVDVNAEKLRSYSPDVGIFYSVDKMVEKTENVPMQNMIAFRDNKLSLMVATKAFGMGIDKPNVRFTVNMNYSNSLEAFVQEAGRAGRDRAMAMSVILVSDYSFIRLNRRCNYRCRSYYDSFRNAKYYLENKWFKEDDLDAILDYYDVTVDKETECTRCNPNVDLVKLACERNQEAFQKFDFQSGCNCPEHGRCSLERLKQRFPGWGTYNELMSEASQAGASLVGRNIEYQNPDYQNMMYFYTKGYPGSIAEKRVMQELMANLTILVGNGDTKEKPEGMTERRGFLDFVLSKNPGEEVVCIIDYSKLDDASFSKAIYRMCCIGLIDDFTRDYGRQTYRVVCRRKKDGGYYACLKDFLMRYYPEDKAEAEIGRARNLRGNNEVHRCLAYLTEFIYEKLAVKKKRAIDEIRTFCNTGLQKDNDWKDINEDLKDQIYYYFNSKFAKEDFVADNGEPYSLTRDTNYGTESPLEIVKKYIRVTEDDVCGASGNPIDNIKHLQGAVRLIMRSLTRDNPAIELLNVFCILFLREYRNNGAIRLALEQSYTNAYRALWDEFVDDKESFYTFIGNYKKDIFGHGADREYLAEMEMIEVNAETMRYRDFLTELGWDKGIRKK